MLLLLKYARVALLLGSIGEFLSAVLLVAGLLQNLGDSSEAQLGQRQRAYNSAHSSTFKENLISIVDLLFLF